MLYATTCYVPFAYQIAEIFFIWNLWPCPKPPHYTTLTSQPTSSLTTLSQYISQETTNTPPWPIDTTLTNFFYMTSSHEYNLTPLPVHILKVRSKAITWLKPSLNPVPNPPLMAKPFKFTTPTPTTYTIKLMERPHPKP